MIDITVSSETRHRPDIGQRNPRIMIPVLPAVCMERSYSSIPGIHYTANGTQYCKIMFLWCTPATTVNAPTITPPARFSPSSSKIPRVDKTRMETSRRQRALANNISPHDIMHIKTQRIWSMHLGKHRGLFGYNTNIYEMLIFLVTPLGALFNRRGYSFTQKGRRKTLDIIVSQHGD